MATTYHFKDDLKPSRALCREEIIARNALGGSKRSNFGSWTLMVAAIAAGAIGGSQLDRWSQGDLLARIDQLGQIVPAAGPEHSVPAAISLSAAGDGQFYADVDFGGRLVTMRVDPTLARSKLSSKDKGLLAPALSGNNAVLSSIKIGGHEVPDATFLTGENVLSHSVIGLDLLKQLGSVHWTGTELSISPRRAG